MVFEAIALSAGVLIFASGVAWILSRIIKPFA